MKLPKRRVTVPKSVAKGKRSPAMRPEHAKMYRHKAEAKKVRLWPSTAATPKPPPFKPKPLRMATTTAKPIAVKSRAMTPHPLPRLAVPPVRRRAARRLPTLRLSEPSPEAAYKEAKAQLRLMRRAARVLRKADRAQERTVRELVRHAAHDLFERQRQAGEANRELRRQQSEQDRADAQRPAQPIKPGGRLPQL